MALEVEHIHQLHLVWYFCQPLCTVNRLVIFQLSMEVTVIASASSDNVTRMLPFVI